MNNLKAKLKKQGGFTLVEMLIVVAIIAILIAVSIPMVTSALERAHHAVDQANIRDAAALGAIEYLTNEDVAKATSDTVYDYVVNDAHQGKLVTTGTTETGYHTITPSCTCSTFATDDILKVTITSDGDVSTNWTFDSANDKTVVN